MSLFTQILILMVVLAAMVMVLLSIRQLTRHEAFDDEEDTNLLKEEVEEDGHVLSHHNIFSNLVEADPVKEEVHDDYKSNSKDPMSRKE